MKRSSVLVDSEFKYVIVSHSHWTQEEIDSLNEQFKDVAKWIYGD